MIDQIQKEVHLALKKDLGRCKVDLPKTFKVEIEFKQHISAYKNSFYPGMKQKNDTTVIFETENYFEVLRMLSFLT
jgi:D-amino peptidase